MILIVAACYTYTCRYEGRLMEICMSNGLQIRDYKSDVDDIDSRCFRLDKTEVLAQSFINH